MILALLGTMVWWHWLILAMLLLVVEISLTVNWFLWVALAAGVVALITLVVPELDWHWQLILFGVISIGSLFVGRRLFQGEPDDSDTPSLNRRGEQHIGRVYTLVDAIENGMGAARVGDTRWQVAGADLPAGRRVRVTEVDGTLLRVVPATNGEADPSVT